MECCCLSICPYHDSGAYVPCLYKLQIWHKKSLLVCNRYSDFQASDNCTSYSSGCHYHLHSSNKIHNGDILVPANPSSPGKMAVKTDSRVGRKV